MLKRHARAAGSPNGGDTVHDLPGDGNRPAERWFLAIREGDTPASNQVCAITAEWVEAWIRERLVEPVDESGVERSRAQLARDEDAHAAALAASIRVGGAS